jgi:hypothetical protein
MISFSAPILWSLTDQQQKFAKNEINWNDSGGQDADRRNDQTDSDEHKNTDRRNDQTMFKSREEEENDLRSRSDVVTDSNVVNVTPNSFSDIFIKPRLAAGMVLVKKKTTEPTPIASQSASLLASQSASPSASPSSTTTAATIFSTSHSPLTTTTIYYSTTTTPYVMVKKKTTPVPNKDVPLLVVGPNSAISFKNLDLQLNTNDPQTTASPQPDPVLDHWSQGNYSFGNNILIVPFLTYPNLTYPNLTSAHLTSPNLTSPHLT